MFYIKSDSDMGMWRTVQVKQSDNTLIVPEIYLSTGEVFSQVMQNGTERIFLVENPEYDCFDLTNFTQYNSFTRQTKVKVLDFKWKERVLTEEEIANLSSTFAKKDIEVKDNHAFVAFYLFREGDSFIYEKDGKKSNYILAYESRFNVVTALNLNTFTCEELSIEPNNKVELMPIQIEVGELSKEEKEKRKKQYQKKFTKKEFKALQEEYYNFDLRI